MPQGSCVTTCEWRGDCLFAVRARRGPGDVSVRKRTDRALKPVHSLRFAGQKGTRVKSLRLGADCEREEAENSRPACG